MKQTGDPGSSFGLLFRSVLTFELDRRTQPRNRRQASAQRRERNQPIALNVL